MSSVAVMAEVRLVQDRTGRIWGRAEFAADRLAIYRNVFDEVTLIARVEPGDPSGLGLVPIEAEWLRVMALPAYSTMTDLTRQARDINRVVWQGLGPADSLVVRLPTTAGVVIYPALRRSKRPYGVEVLGDPGEFRKDVVNHRLVRLLARFSVSVMRRFTRHATAAVYVTQRRLQSRFPAGSGTLSVGVTDTVIPENWYATSDALTAPVGPSYDLVTVGSLEQPYKGVDTLLEVTRILLDEGRRVRLRVVGDGKLREHYELRAQQVYGLGDAVQFEGQLTGDQVRATLASSDVFVLASLTEGLPKVLVEAMAAGLPCVATRVGGVPELLADEDLVRIQDPDGIARTVWEILSDERRYMAAARRNLATAQSLMSADVQALRDQALLTLRAATDRWSAGH